MQGGEELAAKRASAKAAAAASTPARPASSASSKAFALLPIVLLAVAVGVNYYLSTKRV